MPGEKNAWDIEQLKDGYRDHKERIDRLTEEVHELKEFKVATIEKLITIFNQLKELQEGDQWIKRLIIGALITGSITGIFAFLSWAIQN